jgi:hypothetical protein
MAIRALRSLAQGLFVVDFTLFLKASGWGAAPIGALLTVTAMAARFSLHAAPLTYDLLAVLVAAAFLEAAFAFRLGCWLFSRMMAGADPDSLRASCLHISRRLEEGPQPGARVPARGGPALTRPALFWLKLPAGA